jgi:hypothetical protein
MKFVVIWAALIFSAGAAVASQSLVVDLSLSMAGFARPTDNRIPGVLERVAVLMEGAGPLRVYGLSGGSERVLVGYTWKQAAALYATPKSFRGSTPLSRAIEEAVAVGKTTDLVVMTDGMEDSGNLDRLADTLGRLVAKNWSVSAVAVVVPFVGTYYTEQTITDAMLPEVEKAVRAKNIGWGIEKPKAECKPGECYAYHGDRALVFFCLSAPGSTARLLDLTRQALNESHVLPLGAVQMAPFQPPSLSVTVEAPPTTRARIKMPAATGEDLMCAEPVSDRMEMSLRVSALSPAAQPSTLRVASLQVIEKPNWVIVPPKLDTKSPGLHRFEVVCPKGSFTEAVSLLPGTFRVRYAVTLDSMIPGWWDEWSADNSWQFPFKVYKLASLIRAVHGKAVADFKPSPLEYRIRMRVQN